MTDIQPAKWPFLQFLVLFFHCYLSSRPLACSNAVPTSKVLIQRLNMTLRYHEGRNWHAMLDKTYYSGMVPQIRELCVAGTLEAPPSSLAK